jgi:hypothetical protein
MRKEAGVVWLKAQLLLFFFFEEAEHHDKPVRISVWGSKRLPHR